MTKIEFIKEKCVFNKPQYKAAEENGFQVRTFITSQVSEEIMQEVHQTWEEHKDMYLPEVIDMLNQEKGIILNMRLLMCQMEIRPAIAYH